MNLLLDTHALLWLAGDHPKLSKKLVAALANVETFAFISAVTAWEYADLAARGRLSDAAEFGALIERFGFPVLDYPADLWRTAEHLPPLHGDPIDRMLIAHAIAVGMTLVTADRRMRQYPIDTLW